MQAHIHIYIFIHINHGIHLVTLTKLGILEVSWPCLVVQPVMFVRSGGLRASWRRQSLQLQRVSKSLYAIQAPWASSRSVEAQLLILMVSTTYIDTPKHGLFVSQASFAKPTYYWGLPHFTKVFFVLFIPWNCLHRTPPGRSWRTLPWFVGGLGSRSRSWLAGW